MTSFSTATLEKKLADLSNTQHSVQTLSLWLIHHRKHAKAIVQAWYKELAKGKQWSIVLNRVRELSKVSNGRLFKHVREHTATKKAFTSDN